MIWKIYESYSIFQIKSWIPSFVDLHVLLHVMMITFPSSESPSSGFMKFVQFTYQGHYAFLRIFFKFDNLTLSKS